jgi:tetratricopeptide (TPR) repeat protein
MTDMPKPRHSKPARPAPKKSAAKPQAKARPKAKAVKPGRSAAPPKAAAKKPAPPAKKDVRRGTAAASHRSQHAALGPSPHDLAVDGFERGFQALQQRQFGRAAELFQQVINGYPDEKELQERARVYLSLCERQKYSHGPSPRSLEERINAATVAINRGAFSEGLSLLRRLEPEHRDNDHIQYMLCVAYSVLGDRDQALGHLKEAIAMNQENRYLASQDADLEALRDDPRFVNVLETAPAATKAAAAAAPARTGARKR